MSTYYSKSNLKVKEYSKQSFIEMSISNGVSVFFFFENTTEKGSQKSGGFSKKRKRLRIFCNRLRIFRNIFLIILFMSFHFYYTIMQVSTRGKLGLEERVKWVVQEDRGSIPRRCLVVLFRFESWEVDCLFGWSIWVCGSWGRVANSFFFLWKYKKSRFSKTRKRFWIFRNQLQIFRNLFLILLFMLT